MNGEYGIAGYFLVSNGMDAFGAGVAPDNWPAVLDFAWCAARPSLWLERFDTARFCGWDGAAEPSRQAGRNSQC